MTIVHVICEGQTEESFVNELLVEPFAHKGIYLKPALIGRPGHKGGNFKFERLAPDVEKRLLADKNCYCTTFFDFYGLPESFPGKNAVNATASAQDKAIALQDALNEKLVEKIGEDAMRRFIPYVQMYEFEGLLFSDPQKMAEGMDRSDLVQAFTEIAGAFDTPEQINNSPQTAPSKRIESLVLGYEKPLLGTLAALEVGLDKMREQCPLFDAWLKRIEALA
ncbi:DUF4276 domain-containing protein [Vibrio parahaemolyticus]|uniref:DUF4276 family protein n=1 Tax=Vibrio parahaemolyticus TaxID=670 RepID=UPI000408CDB5|nr:DUF4276 family protein [Vibrio parahaemolyticus]EGR3302283.1 DUF4276 domain-containing protein [Vibrio parahaemolyticus]EGR3304642.1 DUF4276 domain-containing protein [Vibrio parahaemolyticus]EGR3317735.1 DUF4276 domain-containing protein [Vibrio parahaemolyticus]EJG1658312.1 DUF4276 family protein [Vibrio parahaemolyticus]EJG1676362.1 DUF4276 family protein [Vibrio parahaemolyticus]